MSIHGFGSIPKMSDVTNWLWGLVGWHELTFEDVPEKISKLIKQHKEHSLSSADVSKQALTLIEKITDEQFNHGEIEIVRRHLCSLLDIEQINYTVAQKLLDYILSPETFIRDIQQKSIVSVINLEKKISERIHSYIKDEISRKLVMQDEALCLTVQMLTGTYLLLLLRLSLFSLWDSENKQVACQHLQTVQLTTELWLCLLENEGQSNKIIASQAKELRSVIEFIRRPHHLPEIEILLGEMHETASPLRFLIPLGDLCGYIGLWDRANIHYNVVVDSVDTSKKGAIDFKVALLKRLSRVCFDMKNYPLVAELAEKIHDIDPNASGDNYHHIVKFLMEKDQYLVASRMIEAGLGRARQAGNQRMELQLLQLQAQLKGAVAKYQQADDIAGDAIHSAIIGEGTFDLVASSYEPHKIADLYSDKPGYGGLALALQEIAENIAEGRHPTAPREETPERRAQRLMSEQKYTEAADLFEKCIESNKTEDPHITDYITIGLFVECCWRSEQHERAILCLKSNLPLWKAQSNMRLYATGCLKLGYLSSYLSRDEEAISYFRESLLIYAPIQESLEPEKEYSISFFEERASTLIGLQSTLLKQKRWDEALICCDQRKAPVLVDQIAKRISPHLMPSSAFTFEQMQALAKEHNTVFVSYAFSLDLTSAPHHTKLTKQLCVYVIAPQGQLECRMLKYDDLPEELKNPKLLFKTFPYVLPDKGSSFLKECRERFERAYEVLLAPIEEILPSDPLQSITIVPEGVLGHIPFGALKDKQGKYLIEKHPVVYTPSIRVLQLLGQIPAQFPDCSLVVYNPMTPDIWLNNLDKTDQEAQNCVIPHLKTHSITALAQSSSTVARVVEEMPKSRWIHLACHGEAERKEDKYSEFEGLFRLAKDDSHPEGCLYAKTIAALRLNAELVFMSACHSGRGNLKQEGTIGHNWSFLAAGALSTVATHWPLPVTAISNQMIKIFYQHLFGDGVEKMTPARALQKAMIYGLEKSPRDPRQWAVFFLTGVDRKVNDK